MTPRSSQTQIDMKRSKNDGLGMRSGAGELSNREFLDLTELDAVLFNLDGVITNSVKLHVAAWQAALNGYLKTRAARSGETYMPFTHRDYQRTFDGKSRYDGATRFLASRNITLPLGDSNDSDDSETVCGLCNRKNAHFKRLIESSQVEVYPDAVAFIETMKTLGLKIAVVSSSEDCSAILEAAGLSDMFDFQMNGKIAAHPALKVKPASDIFLEAAGRLGVPANRAAVIEDAGSGVRQVRAGEFAIVIGIDRSVAGTPLENKDADMVVSNLGKLRLGNCGRELSEQMHSPLDQFDEIAGKIGTRRVALFLDYDGTLTPIVDRPELALLSDRMRQLIKDLVRLCPVAIISGRARGNVEAMVKVDDLIYAGSHGFDIAGPHGQAIASETGRPFVQSIQEAGRKLQTRLNDIGGVIVEPKIFSLAVHYRLVADDDLQIVAQAVDEVAAQHPQLRKSFGKKVTELRPDVDWDKGKAIDTILNSVGLEGPDVVSVFLGDDVTDNDAFRTVRHAGVPILVAETDRPTLACYRLKDCDEVEAFLTALANLLETRSAQT